MNTEEILQKEISRKKLNWKKTIAKNIFVSLTKIAKLCTMSISLLAVNSNSLPIH